MEKQGIITGIGNTITPEIDAVINEYIVGKNTILKGLGLNGNILSAGTCILCGYRGTLENSQTVDGNYVYGKFVIGVNETDSFSIITSSNSNEPTDGIINPTSITSAGTYYLRLYANGASQVDSERYPKQAHTSYNADHLQPNGTIASTAKTETAPVNDNSKRVANTKYVHNQIEKEIDGGTYSNTFSVTDGSLRVVLERRAKFVIGQIGNADASLDDTPNTFSISLPDGFKPNKDIFARVAIGTKKFIFGAGDGRQPVISTYQINMATSGEVTFTLLAYTDVYSSGNVSINVIGYECQ